MHISLHLLMRFEGAWFAPHLCYNIYVAALVIVWQNKALKQLQSYVDSGVASLNFCKIVENTINFLTYRRYLFVPFQFFCKIDTKILDEIRVFNLYSYLIFNL
jgi:hypothetical protein